MESNSAIVVNAVRELRSRHNEKINNPDKEPDSVETIENRAIIRSSKFKVKEKIYSNLLHERTKMLMNDGDFSLFGDMSDQVQELFTAVQKVTFSTSARNATAVLITVNPPPDLEPLVFKTNMEKFIAKIVKLGYHGCYYYEQRSDDIEDMGMHAHICLRTGDFQCELRKKFAQIITRKTFSIYPKNPSPQQFNFMYAKTSTAYLKMVEYSQHPKKKNSDNSDISDYIRNLLEVEPIIEF